MYYVLVYFYGADVNLVNFSSRVNVQQFTRKIKYLQHIHLKTTFLKCL